MHNNVAERLQCSRRKWMKWEKWQNPLQWFPVLHTEFEVNFVSQWKYVNTQWAHTHTHTFPLELKWCIKYMSGSYQLFRMCDFTSFCGRPMPCSTLIYSQLRYLHKPFRKYCYQQCLSAISGQVWQLFVISNRPSHYFRT